eukprot:UC1_evm1s966
MHGWCELHQAAKYGHESHVSLLLAYGADVNCTNVTGNTPLHVCGTWCQEAIAAVLLARGANPELRNRAGQTPYQVATLAGASNVAELLRSFDRRTATPVTAPPVYFNRRKASIVKGRETSARGGRSVEALQEPVVAEEHIVPATAPVSANTSSSSVSMRSSSSLSSSSGAVATAGGIGGGGGGSSISGRGSGGNHDS